MSHAWEIAGSRSDVALPWKQLGSDEVESNLNNMEMSQHPALRQAQKTGRVAKLCFNCCFTHTNHSRFWHGDHANKNRGLSKNGQKKTLLSLRVSPPTSSLQPRYCTIRHRMTAQGWSQPLDESKDIPGLVLEMEHHYSPGRA